MEYFNLDTVGDGEGSKETDTKENCMDNVKLLGDQKEKVVSNQEYIDEEINDESDKPEF